MVEVVAGEGVEDVDFDAAGAVVVLVLLGMGGGKDWGGEGKERGERVGERGEGRFGDGKKGVTDDLRRGYSLYSRLLRRRRWCFLLVAYVVGMVGWRLWWCWLTVLRRIVSACCCRLVEWFLRISEDRRSRSRRLIRGRGRWRGRWEGCLRLGCRAVRWLERWSLRGECL